MEARFSGSMPAANKSRSSDISIMCYKGYEGETGAQAQQPQIYKYVSSEAEVTLE